MELEILLKSKEDIQSDINYYKRQLDYAQSKLKLNAILMEALDEKINAVKTEESINELNESAKAMLNEIESDIKTITDDHKYF